MKEMSKEDAKKVFNSADFQNWFSKSSRYVERALSCEFIINSDFLQVTEDDENQNEAGEIQEEKRAKLTRKFVFEETNVKKRSVTSMDWSPSNPEHLLASFSKS